MGPYLQRYGMMAEKSAAAEALRKREEEDRIEKIEETKDPGEGGSGTKDAELDVNAEAELNLEGGQLEQQADVKVELVRPTSQNTEEGQSKGKEGEKRRPSNVTVLPYATSRQAPTYHISPAAKNVIGAAETYIGSDERGERSVLNSDFSSRAQFDVIIKHLISVQPSSSPTPTTPRQPSSPNSPRTPKPLDPPPSPPPGFIPELGDVYTACQAYVDSYIANNPPSHITPTVIANLHLDILKWRRELIATAHGKSSLQSPQNRNADKLIRILLERTFKGLAKYDPLLKKNVALVDGQVVGTDEVLGVQGFEVVRETVTRWMRTLLPGFNFSSVKQNLPDSRRKAWAWTKIGLTALLVTTFWLFLYSLLTSVTPILWHYAFPNSNIGPHNPHGSSHYTSNGLHIPILNINIPLPTTTHSFSTQLHTFTKNLNTTERYYQRASKHADTAIEDLLSKTDKLVLDLRHVAFVKLWNGLDILGLFGDSGKKNKELAAQSVKRLVHVYLEGMDNARRKLEGEKRVLSDALGKLDGMLEGLERAGDGLGRWRWRWNPLRSHARYRQTNQHVLKSLEDIKNRHDNQGRLAKEHLFVLYEELEVFMAKVKGEIEGGDAKSWWLADGNLRNLAKSLRGRVKELRERVEKDV